MNSGEVKIRPLDIVDAEKIFPILSKKEVVLYLPFDPHASKIETEKFLSGILGQCTNGKGYAWKILKSGTIIRLADLLNIENNSGSLAYILDSKYWNQGIGSYVIGRVLEFGFNELGLSEIRAPVVSRNKGSSAVLLNNGFSHSGKLEREFIFDGKPDYAVMYILKAEEFKKLNKY